MLRKLNSESARAVPATIISGQSSPALARARREPIEACLTPAAGVSAVSAKTLLAQAAMA
ncbi:hypothetical protein [Arenibaculum pallidiluteum]|uniref:hypothetical protein n=1 Tax=Arenibaculum pallidiluteum TaxID=2812559 RepID=UPI001A960041|nr:hypothetical protein [Arenibaculum pallidiluteum]